MPNKSYRVMLSAGEPSGDRQGAEFFRALAGCLPGVEAFGLGGKAMARAGVSLNFEAEGLAVIGVTEALQRYLKIRKTLKGMETLIDQQKPDLLVCIDYKEFNLRLARYAKQAGTKVLFYIGPQVWAWRPGRLRHYARAVDRMAVIFPFEIPFYQRAGIPTRYVGHPLVSQICPQWAQAKVMQTFGLNAGRPLLALLPGSREDEVRRLAPLLAESVRRLQARLPEIQTRAILADSIDDGLWRQVWPEDLPVPVVRRDRHELLRHCQAAVVCSGTATLELALLEVPMVIIYKLSKVTYQLARLLVRTPYIGLPNILAGQSICPELIQDRATPESIASHCHRLLTDVRAATAQRSQLATLQSRLGDQDASHNLAILATELLQGDNR